MILPDDGPPLVWPPNPPPGTPRPEALKAYVQAAAWALIGYACADQDPARAHRTAAAMGLADGLWGHPPKPPPYQDPVLLAAYRTGYATGSIVSTGNASS